MERRDDNGGARNSAKKPKIHFFSPDAQTGFASLFRRGRI
jgi:hypothetical protein